MSLTSTGNLGIGTTTPSAQLTTTGTVRFAGLGSGSLQTDANGNVTVSSDERLKNIQINFSRGLADLQNINPITFKWKSETGYDTQNSYTGFSAQNIQLAIPEAISTDAKGYLSLSDRPILATVVNAVKEIAQKLQTILAWFGGDGSKFSVQGDVCVDDVCITKEQFKALILQNSNGSSSNNNYSNAVNSSSETENNDTGNNPAANPDATSTDSQTETTNTGVDTEVSSEVDTVNTDTNVENQDPIDTPVDESVSEPEPADPNPPTEESPAL
jgi:hypothetical protein